MDDGRPKEIYTSETGNKQELRKALQVVWVAVAKNSTHNRPDASPVALHPTGAQVDSILKKKPRRSIYKTGFMTPEDMGRVQLPLKKCINNMNSRTVKMLRVREGNELTNNNNVTGRKSRKQSNKTYKFRDNRPRRHVTQVILSHVYENQKWLVS